MHPFQQFICTYTPLPTQDWLIIEKTLKRQVVPTGTILLEEGEICRHIYFLESGLLRYFIWKDGLDITKFFTQPPYCFTSQRSYNLEIPAQENIIALENSVLWTMTKKNAEALFELKSWGIFVRKLVQEVQFFTEEILLAIQNKTAEQRYLEMLLNNDPLLQQVPLKHLASFFGIAPQSLSRIRKKLYTQRTK